VLVAIGFAEYAQPVVDVVRDAFLRGISVFAITDVQTSPLSRNSAISFLFDDSPTASFRPIAGPIALVQAITITLSTR
jgi:DNA-binding MurR/RpiR family transcriptional regulator